MTDLPNFERVTLDEAIEQGDALIAKAHATSTRPLLSDWVTETNAARRDAKAAYEAETVELNGVILVPGETLVTLTINERYGSGPRRQLNCVFLNQYVASFSGYTSNRPQRERRFRFLKYGGNDGGSRQITHSEESLVKIDPVAKVPDWLAAREARRKEREA